MGDAFKKVQRGQRLNIPADAYNAFLDAVRQQRSRRHDQLQDADQEFRQSGIVKVKNLSGGDRDRFDVLMIDEPIVEPFENLREFKNRPTFDGYAPAEVCFPGAHGSPEEPIYCKQFVILHEPIRAGGIGRAVIAGVTPARLNVLRETDPFAEVAPYAGNRI